MPTPETDEVAWREDGIMVVEARFAETLERSRDYLSARLIERTIAYEAKDRAQKEEIQRLKERLVEKTEKIDRQAEEGS